MSSIIPVEYLSALYGTAIIKYLDVALAFIVLTPSLVMTHIYIEERKGVVLCHQQSQSGVKIRLSPLPRYCPASKLQGQTETQLYLLN